MGHSITDILNFQLLILKIFPLLKSNNLKRKMSELPKIATLSFSMLYFCSVYSAFVS